MKHFFSFPPFERLALLVFLGIAAYVMGGTIVMQADSQAKHFAFCASNPLASWEIESGKLSFEY